jgi:quinol-cytochrome oxidoreductase complex cytochrome b subunit
LDALKRGLRAVFLRLEAALEAVFGPRHNPLTQLGTLGWFLFWIVTVSGIYVYIFFDTGVTQAWESLDKLSREQWYLGGVMRSLHRYASDALVLVILVHALREFAMDRMRGNRWFPWVTGIPLLWFLYACGITGYWLVWDQLAQYVAVATTEWLDSIGIFAEPIARNFLDSDRLSGRFFTLIIYMHIALPLLMLLAMWIHIQRHAHARVNPPRALAIGTLGALVALSFAWPAMSQAPANLDRAPFSLGLDWFYLAVFPLLERVPGGTLWLLLVGGSVLLALLPWLPPLRKAPAARVDLGNCNGCARCFADCPFGAITMCPDRWPGFGRRSVDGPRRLRHLRGRLPTAPFRRVGRCLPESNCGPERVGPAREVLAARLSGTRA